MDEETKISETNIDEVINDYNKNYLDKEKLPENDFTLNLPSNKNNEDCFDINHSFELSKNNLNSYIINNDQIHISNISNEEEFIKFYNELYSLKYENVQENIEKIYKFILSQSNLNNGDNIISSKKTLSEFMSFLSLCVGSDVKEIKDQCGKDNVRGTIFLNNKILKLNSTLDNNVKQCDEYNLKIMEEMKEKKFKNIDKIYDYIIYIDILTHQTILNMFTFNMMNLSNKLFDTLPYHHTDSDLSVNLFILIDENKLQVHRMAHCYIYNFERVSDYGAHDAFKKGVKPDGIFTFYVIFDLLENKYYIKDYLLKINPIKNINNNISNNNISNDNISKNNIKNIISENKGSATIGTLLTLGALSAIPLALLLGGKKTQRAGKRRKNKTYRRRKERKTRNKKYKNKKYKNKTKK